VDPGALISAAGVPETARGEALGIDQFCALARAFATASTGPSVRPSRTR
jgi:hypothetical protein